MNCKAYLKRVLVAARYWDITTHDFHAPDSVQLDATFHHGLFLKKEPPSLRVFASIMFQITVSHKEAIPCIQT